MIETVAGPSIRCTAFTDAPDCTRHEAAECRRSCTHKPAGSVTPDLSPRARSYAAFAFPAATALPKSRRLKLLACICRPRTVVNRKSSGRRPFTSSASMTTRNGVTETVLALPDFGGPTTGDPPRTNTMARARRMRRRFKCKSFTRSSTASPMRRPQLARSHIMGRYRSWITLARDVVSLRNGQEPALNCVDGACSQLHVEDPILDVAFPHGAHVRHNTSNQLCEAHTSDKKPPSLHMPMATGRSARWPLKLPTNPWCSGDHSPSGWYSCP